MTTTRSRLPEVESAPRRHPVRRVAKWLGLVAAVTVVGVGAWWVLASTGTVPAPAPITVAAPAAPVPTFTGPIADGCDDVRAAQATSTLDISGAARVALSYVRWASTYPASADAAAVLGQVVAPANQAAETALLTRYAATVAADGFTTMTPSPGNAATPDLYRIVNADPAGASMTVTVVAHAYAAKTAIDTATVKYPATIILDVIDGHWMVAGKTPGPTDPYAPIPGVPWVSFDGIC